MSYGQTPPKPSPPEPFFLQTDLLDLVARFRQESSFPVYFVITPDREVFAGSAKDILDYALRLNTPEQPTIPGVEVREFIDTGPAPL